MISLSDLSRLPDSTEPHVPGSILARELLATVPGGLNASRYHLLQVVLSKFPDARVVECSAERTGRRFGRAACRAGRCIKLGGGGRGSARAYQLWAVWA